LTVLFDGIEPKGKTTYQLKEKQSTKHQLIMVGRLIDLKGHRFLLQIMPKLVEKYGDSIQVNIVGNGTIKDTLEKMSRDLKVDKYVHFLGFQSNIFDLISNSDISLCLSTSEGFGLVILESFDAQTPVIAFDVSACNEIIKHQKNGILVPPYDRQAHQDVRERFSFDRMVEETIQFYRSVLG